MNYDRRNMPKCFTFVDDGREWNHHADIADKPKHRANYCTDCLPSFKRRMIAEGRCRFPATTFVTHVAVDHIEIIGVRA